METGRENPDEIIEFAKPAVYYKYALYKDLYTRLPGLIGFASDYIVYFQKKKT